MSIYHILIPPTGEQVSNKKFKDCLFVTRFTVVVVVAQQSIECHAIHDSIVTVRLWRMFNDFYEEVAIAEIDEAS